MKALDRSREPNEADDEGEESPDEDFREEAEAENDAADESDGEGAGGAGKGEEEELDEGEAADLKRDLGEDLRAGKRRKRGEGVGAGDDDESQRENDGNSKRGKPSQESEEAWKSIKEAAADADKGTVSSNDQEEMVKVIKTYKFAGDEVREEKLLPASHPDAVAYLKKQADGAGRPASVPAPATAASSSPAIARGSGGPAPGPRRKKGGGLAAMSAAASAKPTKINTLEKSKMDWDRFKSTADAAAADAAAAADDGLTERERDEMESQTKGGSSGLGSMKGYMERRGFLDRVEERLQNKDR